MCAGEREFVDHPIGRVKERRDRHVFVLLEFLVGWLVERNFVPVMVLPYTRAIDQFDQRLEPEVMVEHGIQFKRDFEDGWVPLNEVVDFREVVDFVQS